MTALIIRPLQGRLEVHSLRGPRGDEPSNRGLFTTATGMSIRPTWVDAEEGQPGWRGFWTISRAHLTVVAEAIAIRDGQVEIEMHYSQAEQCDRRCQDAKGDDCTCSCEGEHHGDGEHASWMNVGDTTLVRGSDAKIVTRLLTRDQALHDQRGRVF